MKRSEKIIFSIITIGLLAIIAVGTTLAYMTDREDRTNRFSVGTLDISLEEKNWDDGEDGKDLVPGDTYVKDPVVAAVKNDSYVRMRVTFRDGDGSIIRDRERAGLIWQMIRYDSSYDAAANTAGTVIVKGCSYSATELALLPDVNPAFRAVSAGNTGEYCFAYSDILREGDKAALFTNIAVPVEWTQTQLDKLGKFKIEVAAEAIQAKNFSGADEAFAALDSEIAAGTAVSGYDSSR